MTADLRFAVPPTASPQASAGLMQMYAMMQAQGPSPLPRSQDEWDAMAAGIEAGMAPLAAMHAEALGVTMTDDRIGGVPVLRLRPADWKRSDRGIVHVHGGGYVLFSARSAASIPALVAAASGHEVISIDYTLAPRGNWMSIGDEVLAVWRALLAGGRSAGSLALMGDSAGGALAAGATLRMRDEELPLPAALYLNSPWADITATGDTYSTLAAFDPILLIENLAASATAYAPVEDHAHPHISPVHGDFSRPFPPTLIQGGTRDMFLSNCVRLYQAIRAGGHEAVLDIYEGLPHVFQPLMIDAPETRTSIERAAAFIDRHLQ